MTPFDLDDAARRVAEMIRLQVPGRKAHLVGLSLGDAVVLNIARLDPTVAGRMMVTGTAARLGKFLGQLSLSSLWMLRYYKPETLVKQSAKQWGIPEAYLPLFQEDLLHATSADFNRTLIENLMRHELPECLPAPLLVTVGGKETIPAKQAARKLTHLYRKAMGRMVPGMGGRGSGRGHHSEQDQNSKNSEKNILHASLSEGYNNPKLSSSSQSRH